MYILAKRLCQNNRVKSLSKTGNSKKDQVASSLSLINKESSSLVPGPVLTDGDDVYEQQQDVKVADTSRRDVEKETTADIDKQSSSFPSNYSLNIREESGMISGHMDKERVDVKNTFGGSTSQKMYSSFSQNSVDTEEKVQKVSPPRGKAYRDDKSEKLGNWLKKDGTSSDQSTTTYKQQNTSNSKTDNMGSRQHELEPPPRDGNINEILEVGYNVGLFIH